MRRTLLTLLAAACALGAGLAGATAQGFQTAAPHAILIDADSGSVLFEKAADERFSPASMAKLMTTDIVFEALKSGRLAMDTEFTVTEDAWKRGRGRRRRLVDVRPGQQPHQDVGPAARADRPVGQRRRDHHRGEHGRHRGLLRRADEPAGQGDRADEFDLPQRHRLLGARPEGHGPGHGQARDPPDRHLPGPVQDLLREGVHLEQDPPAEPQSAPGARHRRRRAEDRLLGGIGLRADRLGGAERPAPGAGDLGGSRPPGTGPPRRAS